MEDPQVLNSQIKYDHSKGIHSRSDLYPFFLNLLDNLVLYYNNPHIYNYVDGRLWINMEQLTICMKNEKAVIYIKSINTFVKRLKNGTYPKRITNIKFTINKFIKWARQNNLPNDLVVICNYILSVLDSLTNNSNTQYLDMPSLEELGNDEVFDYPY